MTDSTPLHDALVWSPSGVMTVGFAAGSVPRRPGEPATRHSNLSLGERPLSNGISTSARENPKRSWSMARPAISNRARESCAFPIRRGAAHSGEGDLPGIVESKDAARLRVALGDARRTIRVLRTELAEGAGMDNRASPNARRESRAGRLAVRRRGGIRSIERDGADPGRERSALKRTHPSKSGIHCPVGGERFASGHPTALMATGDCRAVAGEHFDPPPEARLAGGIATNSRRIGMHRRRGES